MKDKRLIEDFIPIKEISKESAREKSIRHSHISTLHIWWARRPLVASRAAVFASLVKTPENKEKKEELTKFLIELCKWENSNNKHIIEKAKKLILENNNGKPPKVLDCFAGGGSIPLEALRLGCETYALDLNPVAYLILLCTLVYPQKYGKSVYDEKGFAKIQNRLAHDVEKWGKWVLEEAKKEIGKFYPNDHDGSVPVAYLWARTVKCPNPSCGAEIPLIRQYWLCKKENKKVSLKPIVNQKEKRVDFKIVEGKEIDFNPSEGTMKKGTATCLVCGNTADGKYIRKESQEGRMGQRMTTVVLTHPKKKGKIYRLATQKDAEVFEKASKELKKYRGKKIKVGKHEITLIPDEPLPPEGSLGISPYWTNKKGENRSWAELFNDRQLLSIITFLLKVREAKEKILEEEGDEEYAKVVVSYLGLNISRYTNFASNLNIWSGDFIKGVFAMQIIQMVWDYCESNPFCNFSGNWLNNLSWIVLVLKDISNIQSFGSVKQGTATNLEYDPKFFDIIITDPPYYDAVPYSDLSDFFFVWLKRGIGDLYPNQFGMLLTPKSSEIIQTSARHEGNKEKAKKWYEECMTKSFRECSRVLKDDGYLTIVFAHKSTTAWETFINSLLDSKLITVSSWPFHTERPGRTRSIESASLASSFFIVCRKRLTNEEGYFNDIKEELEKKVKQKLEEFWKQGIRGADFFISAIGPAVEVFGKYKKVRKLSGEEVSVAEFLDLVRQIVTDYSLRKILHEGSLGEIDEITRFYILWRWAYNNNEILFDDARKLAQALGAETDQLIHKRDILLKKGDKVKLLGPKERAKNKDLGEQKGGMPAPMIDVIHKACLLWEKGNKQELTDFIATSGYEDNETIWNVAQALSEILPEGDKEKQLLQGLLASKSTAISERFKTQRTLTSFNGE
ncbi:MAG: DUF1156 domain-containing protein [Candidatus Heimdallarchaeaceae archaeon]